MNIWKTVPIEGAFWATLFNEENGVIIKSHPIPFTDKREADRAVARLNVRDAPPQRVPHAHMDEH